MEENFYNLNHLVKIRVRDFRKAVWVEYRTAKSWLFGLLKRKAGVYSTVMGQYEGEEIDSDYYTLIDDVLYLNPTVTLYFTNEYECIKYFKTLEEANEFAGQFTDYVTKID